MELFVYYKFDDKECTWLRTIIESKKVKNHFFKIIVQVFYGGSLCQKVFLKT